MWGTRSGPDRAQSEVLGVVLLFALVLAVSGTVVLVGGQALNDAKSATSSESAAITMEELQSKAAQSDGSAQRVSFAQSGGRNAEASGSSVDAADGSARIEESDSLSINENAGSIMIEVNDTDDGNSPVNVTRPLGRVTYEEDDQTLAYQGGGVFRQSAGSSESVLISPPDFDYRYESGTPTLSMGITRLNASDTGIDGDSFTLQQVGTTRHFPTSSIPNPLEEGDTITITIKSRYYLAWGSLFEERTEASVTTSGPDSNGTGTATLKLHAPSEPTPMSPGAILTSDVPGLTFDNHAHVDSYDSTASSPPQYDHNAPVFVRGTFSPSNHVYIDGDLIVEDRIQFDPNDNSPPRPHVEGRTITGGTPSSGSSTEVNGNTHFKGIFSTKDDLRVEGQNHNPGRRARFAGPVYVGGDVTRLADVTIEGDLHAQGDVFIAADTEIQGDITAGGTITVDGGASPTVTGTMNDGPSADPQEPIDPDLPSLSSVSDEIDSVESTLDDGNNDNGAKIDEIETWDGCDPSCTLTGSSDTSEYYVENGITLSDSETLVLDTTTGPITIYAGPGANGALYLNDGRIEVHGDNPVKIYSSGNFEMTGDTEIVTMNSAGTSRTYRAPNFQLFMHPSASANLNGHPELTGVVRGPGDPDGTDITVTNDAIVHGALIGEITAINNHAEIHFDEALLDPDAGTSGGTGYSGKRVSYLQISSNEVAVED